MRAIEEGWGTMEQWSHHIRPGGSYHSGPLPAHSTSVRPGLIESRGLEGALGLPGFSGTGQNKLFSPWPLKPLLTYFTPLAFLYEGNPRWKIPLLFVRSGYADGDSNFCGRIFSSVTINVKFSARNNGNLSWDIRKVSKERNPFCPSPGGKLPNEKKGGILCLNLTRFNFCLKVCF